MHHADAFGHRVVRGSDGRLLAVEIDLAAKAARFMNDGHAEKHVHQRALARAVFAQQRVDLAFFELPGLTLSDTPESTAFSPYFLVMSLISRMYSEANFIPPLKRQKRPASTHVKRVGFTFA